MFHLTAPSSCKVYTPQTLADAMVAAIAHDKDASWLEPGCGKGVFLRSLQALGVSSSRIHAIDLDASPCENDALAMVVRGTDYLNWAQLQQSRFDCIVGNPPYIAIRSLPRSLQSTAAEVLDHQGLPLGKRSNTWYAFLQSSLRLMKEGGNLAFVLPASCEFAGYCKSGREHIVRMFERVDLVRSQRPLFLDVQDGAAVLICRNRRDGQGIFRRHQVADLQATLERLRSLTEYKAQSCRANRTAEIGNPVWLGDVLSVKLGGVTGDSQFFTMTERRRRELNLPLCSVTPIVSKCRQVRGPQINFRIWDLLKSQNERVWLFNPSERVSKNPAVKNYLELCESSGGCHKNAYKIRNRSPWYRTPLPTDVHGFVSGMSGDGIWICMNSMRRLNATNTLYTVSFRPDKPSNARYACALALLTTSATAQLKRLQRRYADGLIKVEPGDLTSIRVPTFEHVLNAKRVYFRALSTLLRGDAVHARRIADSAVCDSTIEA